MISPRTMEEAYQCAVRAEEKITRKKSFNRGRGSAQRKKASDWKRKIWATERGVQ